MAFSLTRPPSPTHDTHPSHMNPGHEDDHLASALHAAVSTFVPGSSHSDHHHDMNKEKGRAGIEIIVESDCLVLKGTGVDVEPAVLSGHVVLHLTEPTSIKGITLQFRGKARLPAPLNEALSLNTSPCWYSICSHDWSFLEGEKHHSHTLKAGFHHFPFQLQLGGSLPSSIASTVYGGAHIYYKLRAIAVRPGLAHNMQAVMPISIMRSFAPEALEYQQSLEIENTWPDKLMYSIMIPHKAWAIGDKLTAIIKLSPLSKGVRVLTVVTNITETTKLHCRGGVQEHTRSVTTVKHELVNAVAVPLVEHHHGLRVPTLNGPHGTTDTSRSVPTTPRLSSEDRSHSSGSLAAHGSSDLTLLVPSGGSSSPPHDSHSVAGPSYTQPSSGEPSTSMPITQDDLLGGNDDIVTQLCVTIPRLATPSHTLEPITVSHRVRWSILMSNLDGHTSELRCSLPLHILHPRLLDEARENSAATRRLLLEGPEAPADEERVVELPSYPAHVRDRVANMYLPDSATTRMMNPWVASGISPTFASESQGQSGAWTPSGAASPLMPHPISSHLPHVPQSGSGTPLDWVNSELLLSLSSSESARPQTNMTLHSHSPSHSDPASQPPSRPESRPLSGHVSRAPSPERHLTMSSMSMSPISSPNESSIHDGQASRSLPGLFSMQMKPLTSLTSPGWLSSRSNSHSNLSSLTDLGHSHRSHSYGNMPVHPSRAATGPHTPPAGTDAAPAPENALWHRAFTEVPDYDVASRGFIGGVTPLTSMRGLPSYEEAERSAVGGDGDGVITVRRGGRVPFWS